MNKTNKLTMLMLTGVLSLGFMNNTIYCAAEPANYENTIAPQTPEDIVSELIAAFEARNIEAALTITKKFLSTANKDEIQAIIRGIVTAQANNDRSYNAYNGAYNGASKCNYIYNMQLTFDRILLLKKNLNAKKNEALFAFYEEILATGYNGMRYFNGNPAEYFTQKYIILAVLSGQIDRVTTLLELGVNVNTIQPETQCSLLMIAVQNGHKNIVQLLIDKQADVHYECKNTHNHTALECAVARNHTALIDLLIQAGARVESTITDSALEISVLNDTAQENPSTKTLLELAAERGHDEAIKQLISAGASITPRALELAVEHGHIKAIEALINASASVTRNAFILACKKDDIDLVAVLANGLLKQQVYLQAERHNGSLRICDQGKYSYRPSYGQIEQSCGIFDQLASDPLNNIMRYVSARDCAALRSTCRGMRHLQPDVEGLRTILCRAAAKKFIRTKKNYLEAVELTSKIKWFIFNLTKYLKEEPKNPICDIKKWEASERKECAKKDLDKKLMDARENLIRIMIGYYATTKNMIQSPELEPAASRVNIRSALTSCAAAPCAASVANSDLARPVACANPQDSAMSLLFDEIDRPGTATTEEERLQIIADQNRAYEDSLRADQTKDQAKKKQDNNLNESVPAMAAPAAATEPDDEEPVRTREQMRAKMAEKHGERAPNKQDTNGKKNN